MARLHRGDGAAHHRQACRVCLFFSQAEDGIRDLTVTGVQTCALPISVGRTEGGMRLGSKIFLTSALVIVVLAGVGFLSLRALGRLVSVNREIATRTVPALRLRSEERRGGEEGRSRWSPDH